MYIIACIFIGSSKFHLKTIKLNIILENTINAHLFGFRLMSYSLHF
jgi:hypothetical protein